MNEDIFYAKNMLTLTVLSCEKKNRGRNSFFLVKKLTLNFNWNPHISGIPFIGFD